LLTFFLLRARRRQSAARPVAGARLRPSPIYTKRMFSFFFPILSGVSEMPNK
jgi:hypothetical protein